VHTLANCPFLLSCEGVASWRKVSLSIRSFLVDVALPLFQELEGPYGH
jgi:hypothetical protein